MALLLAANSAALLPSAAAPASPARAHVRMSLENPVDWATGQPNAGLRRYGGQRNRAAPPNNNEYPEEGLGWAYEHDIDRRFGSKQQ